jgi:hypothetical protein
VQNFSSVSVFVVTERCSLLILVSANQIERLYSRFTSLDKGDTGTLCREDFLRIPELAINPVGERIVNAFFKVSSSGQVVAFSSDYGCKEWLKSLL